MRISNLCYLHTNEFETYNDILITADMSEEILDSLEVEENDTQHISVLVEGGKVSCIQISDGWMGGNRVELTEEENKEVLKFIENEGIMKDGKILKY